MLAEWSFDSLGGLPPSTQATGGVLQASALNARIDGLNVQPAFVAGFGSALTVDDFTKQVHVIGVDRAGFDAAAPIVAELADAEGFAAHAESVRLRQRALGADA